MRVCVRVCVCVFSESGNMYIKEMCQRLSVKAFYVYPLLLTVNIEIDRQRQTDRQAETETDTERSRDRKILKLTSVEVCWLNRTFLFLPPQSLRDSECKHGRGIR